MILVHVLSDLGLAEGGGINTPKCFKMIDRNLLSNYILKTFSELEDLFHGLTISRVIEIQKEIINGTYSFSPLIINAFPIDFKLNDELVTFYHIPIDNIYYGIKPCAEDNLVLTSIGFMLNKYFYKMNLFTVNSFGNRLPLKVYYHEVVCRRGETNCVYKFDLTKSIWSLKRDILLSKLEILVQDDGIMNLVTNFHHKRIPSAFYQPSSCSLSPYQFFSFIWGLSSS